jgi:uncharacterized caspase-like protein
MLPCALDLAHGETLDLAHGEKRVALVVGNASYRHADRLANPVNDARGMRDALKKLGFDVIYGEDLDQNALRRAIGQLADRADGANLAMVYFAGHGATFGDTPYVVPVDAEFSSMGQVPYELVPVDTLIGELHRVKGVRIAILDACRDNKAERELKRVTARGGDITRGLGRIKNPEGLIVAYSTQYMSTAADDAGAASAGGLFVQHSPFTAALLNNIATPGLDVTDLFRKVGREVYVATGGRQRPEISISMYDEYALVPAATRPETAPPSAAALPDARTGTNAAVTALAKPAAPQPAAVALPVMPVPSTPPTVAPQPKPVNRRLHNPAEIAQMVKKGAELMAIGDVAAARLMYQRTAEAGEAMGAFALAETYDPLVLAKGDVRPNVGLAHYWYEKAGELGWPVAERLERLSRLPH